MFPVLFVLFGDGYEICRFFIIVIIDETFRSDSRFLIWYTGQLPDAIEEEELGSIVQR